MGRGNFCPSGDLTMQWYIDYENFRNEYGYDEWLLQHHIEYAMEEIKKRFPSFRPIEKYVGTYWCQIVLLENELFEIGTADNEWSLAFYIRDRRDIWNERQNLANKHFETYKKEIQNILLDIFQEVYLRNGAWMSSKITKEKMYA